MAKIPIMKTLSLEQQIKQADAGIPIKELKQIMAKSPFSKEKWLEVLNISERSFLRYEKENRSLGHPQSDIILKMQALTNRGIEVFGSVENFHTWLHQPVIALGEKPPISFLHSILGIDYLLMVIGRIEHGITA